MSDFAFLGGTKKGHRWMTLFTLLTTSFLYC